MPLGQPVEHIFREPRGPLIRRPEIYWQNKIPTVLEQSTSVDYWVFRYLEIKPVKEKEVHSSPVHSVVWSKYG